MKRIDLTLLTIAALFTFVESASAVTVPEGGATAGLLAIALVGLVALRRKLSK